MLMEYAQRVRYLRTQKCPDCTIRLSTQMNSMQTKCLIHFIKQNKTRSYVMKPSTEVTPSSLIRCPFRKRLHTCYLSRELIETSSVMVLNAVTGS